MKNKIIKILIGVFILLIITIGAVLIYKNSNKNDNINNNNNYSNVVLLDINKLKEKIDNKDTFILIISRDDCSHCIAYLPVVNKVGIKYNITFYDISQTDLSDGDLTYLRNIANISGTPTTVFIIDGEEKNIQNRIKGEAKEYRLIEKLKSMGYINENVN